MLMDWESWWLWERLAVGALAESRDTAEGLGRLRAAVEHVRSWRPSGETLTSRIEAAFHAPSLVRPVTRNDRRRRLEEVLMTMPSDIRPAGGPPPGTHVPSTAVHRDFLIAHAFANWTAHLGQGLRTWLRSLEAADALIASGFGVGTADLWLRHLSDPWVLAEVWGEAERE
jgi:hypothetical protein